MLLLFLFVGQLWGGTAAPKPKLDLTVKYMFYACEPCPYAYQVVSSGTPQGQFLVGHDIAITYQGHRLDESQAFPAVTKTRNQLRVQGYLQPCGIKESLFSHERTIDSSSVEWLP